MEQIPLVSICCITYNHANYISNTIESFLKQETTFSYEIIINDDASTDGTAAIIKEYHDKFPDIIKPILQKENQYSKGIRGMNPRFTFPVAKGKYIAVCEGDDCWIDPHKLQRQVDFLENHEDFTLTCSFFLEQKGDIINEVTYNTDGLIYNEIYNGYEFGLKDTVGRWLTKTLTLCFRKSAINGILEKDYKYLRDVHVVFHILDQGMGFLFKEFMGMYISHGMGVHSALDKRALIETGYNVYKELSVANKNHPLARAMFLRASANLFQEYLLIVGI